ARGIAGDQIRDAGVALPPVLVGLPEAAHDDGHARWSGRLGDAPDLVRAVAERAQEIHLARIGVRELTPFAHAHHLRAAGLSLSRLSGNVREVLRPPGIADVGDRGAVASLIAGERVELSAAVMADVGEPPIAVLANQRLVGAARLQVVETDQPHVAHVGPLLRRDAVIADDAQPRQGNPDRRRRHVRTSHVHGPLRTGPGAPRNLGDDTPAGAFRQRKGTWLPGTVPGV